MSDEDCRTFLFDTAFGMPCGNGNLFLPPPGVDAYDAYAQALSLSFAALVVGSLIGLAWS